MFATIIDTLYLNHDLARVMGVAGLESVKHIELEELYRKARRIFLIL
ncbi:MULTISPECIES: hypothetical protein [Bacillus]|nr:MULTISPECIES: hypothetical protein [Bacillus]